MDCLDERSKQLRRDVIRLSKANGGYHYGGSFSCVEIILALYDHILRADDTFILSKGHACWPLYVLLRERGRRPKLEGHPVRDPNNGIEWTTGSLGHGLPAAVGKALARKLTGREGRVFVLMSDGELQEGTTWESILVAVHHNLSGLTAIVDMNGIQGSGYCSDILDVQRVPAAARSLGCAVEMVSNGHCIDEVVGAADSFSDIGPKFIFANTIKGRGVTAWENQPEWHAKWPSPEEEANALEDLN